MKHLKFLAALCCMLAVFTACEKNEPNDNGNGSNTGNYANGHDYVDLGLPSGLKWATCNVGATKPEEYGNYYAWGETEPKSTYDWSTYKWATATYDNYYNEWFLETLTKYNTSSSYGTVDNKTVLELADDAAHANWGGAWRMPTVDEWAELCENCTWTWTDDYNGTGVAGQIVTGPNGNSIFLPAPHEADGYFGHYWSGSLGNDGCSGPRDAWDVYIDSDFVRLVRSSYRDCGLSVRPVLFEGLENGGNSNTGSDNATGTANGHAYVDLGLPSGLKWATCNVGATTPGKYGNYYAWGETSTKSTYDWSTYKWCNGSSSTLTKYNTDANYGTVDNKTQLELADDAARANWGGQWRMPTKEECEELLDNCTLKWVYSYKDIGVSGLIVTGPNGNSIFLPAAGFRGDYDMDSAGDYGFYWSSSLNSDGSNDAWYVTFNSNCVGRGSYNRYCGRSVRPVLGE